MSQIVKCGLIQCSNPLNDESVPVADIQKAMLEKHLPMIDEAGAKGVQILCLQEIFNGPYFSYQDPRWYAAAEPIPGPTTPVAEYASIKWSSSSLYTRRRCEVCILTRRSSTPFCILANIENNTSLKPADSGKILLRAGDGGYPVFETRYARVGVYICYDRHFPEGARCLGLNGAEIVFNPSATVAGLSQYLWKLEQPAHAVANGYFVGAINRVGTEAPWNIGKFYGSSYFVNPGTPAEGSEDEDELIIADLDLSMIDGDERPGSSIGIDGLKPTMNWLNTNGG